TLADVFPSNKPCPSSSPRSPAPACFRVSRAVTPSRTARLRRSSIASTTRRRSGCWTATRCLTVPITDANRHLLRSAYEARTKAELPVLVRWFEGVESPVANWLAVILYSRAQLAKEGEPIAAEWGIVGCLYTMEPEEIPMAPITMLRNALGVEEGGSGVPLDREAHRRSVAFWGNNANWRP